MPPMLVSPTASEVSGIESHVKAGKTPTGFPTFLFNKRNLKGNLSLKKEGKRKIIICVVFTCLTLMHTQGAPFEDLRDSFFTWFLYLWRFLEEVLVLFRENWFM